MSFSKLCNKNNESVIDSELNTSSSTFSDLSKRNPLANIDSLKEGAKEVLTAVNQIFDVVKPVTLAHIICEMLGHTSRWTIVRCVAQLLELYKGPLLSHWKIIVDALKSLAALVSRKDGDTVQEQDPEPEPKGATGGDKPKACKTALSDKIAQAETAPPDEEAVTAKAKMEAHVDRAKEEMRGKFARWKADGDALLANMSQIGGKNKKKKKGAIDLTLSGPVRVFIDTKDGDLLRWSSAAFQAAEDLGAKFVYAPSDKAEVFVSPLHFTSREAAEVDVAKESEKKGTRLIFFFGPAHPKLDDVPHEERVSLFGWKVVDCAIGTGKKNEAQSRALTVYLNEGEGKCDCVDNDCVQWHAGDLQDSIFSALKGAYASSVEVMVGWVGALLAGLVALASLFPENKFAKKAADRFLALASNAGKLHAAADDSLYAYDAVQGALKVTLAPVASMTLKDAHSFMTDVKSLLQRRPHMLTHPAFPMDSINALYDYAAARTGKGKSIGAKCWADIMSDCSIVQRAHKDRFNTATTRPMPVVLCLAGPPGVGKTTVVRQVATEINEIFGTVGYDAWQCGLDHQDQNAGRPVVTMEEFGALDLSRDQAALQRLADTNPFVTDNDVIHNKGRHEAPAVVIVTTNCQDIYTGFAYPDALSRRVSHHVLVKNDGLEAWKTRHPNKVPTDQKYTEIFSACPSVYYKLPAGACDWQGNYLHNGLQGNVPLNTKALDALVRDIKATVRNRWRNVLEDETEMPGKLVFHAKDVPVMVFRGPPGCGKTTLAGCVAGQFEVINDSWTKKDAFKTVVDHVMHLEEHADPTPVLITTNINPWRDELAKMPKEQRLAFERRVKYYNFSYKKKNFLTHYTHADMKDCGWSKIVDVVGPDGSHYTYTTLVEELRAAAPVQKAVAEEDAPIQNEAYACAAETNMSVAQVGAGEDPLKVLLSFERHNVPGLNMLTSFSSVVKQIQIQGKTRTHPKSLVCSINDAKLVLKIPPCSVKFADAVVNFWSYEGKLRCALVKEGVKESAGLGFSTSPSVDPFAFDQVVEDEYELPKSISGALLNVMTTVLGMVAMAMEAKVTFHTPTEEDEKGPARRVTRSYRPVRDSDFQPAGRLWAEDRREMGYTERITFDSNNWIVPCFDAAGCPKGWAISTPKGLLANRHVIAGTTRLGHQKVGESVVLNYGDTDLCLIKNTKNPYQLCKAPFSRPIVGEILYQLKPSGMQRARVHSFVRVANPSGKLVEMCLVEGGVSDPGDCGLPWVRRVGRSVELVGLAAGTRGARLMVVPLGVDPAETQWHARTHNYTFLHQTQYFGIVGDDKSMMPSDKVWEGGDEGVMAKHSSEVFFKPGQDNSVSRAAVDASKEYLEHLVPEEKRERWGVLSTVKSLDMCTAAGPSYGTVKQQVFNPDGAPVKQHAATFWRGVNNPCDGKCRISLKDELRPAKKRELGLTRPIFCFDVHDTVRVKSQIGSGLQALADTCGTHIWSVGISQQNGTWGQVCERLSKWRYAMDADFGRWDSTNSHPLMKQAAEVLASLATRDHREEVEEDLSRMLSAQTQFGPTMTGLPSGLVCTAQMNCTSHLLTINDILLGHGAAPVGSMGCPLDFVSYGDDIVLAMDDPKVATWLINGWKKRGFQATSAAKTGPPQCGKLQDMTFIKRSFKKVDGEWRAPLEAASIWKGLSWMRGHTSYDHSEGVQNGDLTGTRAVGVFQSVMSEFWQHGKEVFEAAKKLIISYARERKLRLPVIIPPYAQFNPKEVLADYNRLAGESSVSMLSVSWHTGGTGEVQPVSQTEGPGGENVGEVVGLPALATGLAHQTAGIETALATSGGPTVQLDPANRERFVMVPGGMVSVRTNMTRGSVVWRKKISPGINMWTNLLSSMYNAWCGGFEVMIVVGANNFIGGKFLVAYFPPNVASGSYSVEQVTAFPHAILDIRLMDNVLLACSDIKYVLWHPTNAAPEDPIAVGGEVVVYLLTNIVTAGNSGNVLTLDMSIFSRPMPDFDFNFLMPISLGGSGGPNDLDMQAAGRALCTPATAGGRGWHVIDVLVATQQSSTVAGDMFASTVRMSGTSPYCIPYPAADGMIVEAIKVSTTDYKLLCYTPDGTPWDVGTDKASKTLPLCWMAYNSASDHTVLTWYKSDGNLEHTNGKITLASVGAQPHYVPYAAAEIPAATRIAVTGSKDGAALTNRESPASPPSFTPNNGESLILYAGLRKTGQKGLTLSTQEMITVFMESPRVTSMCGLFNVSDATGATTVQAKLYPNGVLTTGTAASAIYYTGPICFTYVGMVPVDYKLNPPAGGTNANVLDLVERLDKWLVLQERSQVGASASSQASLTQQLLSESLGSIKRRPLKSKLETLDSDEESFETILQA
uniref:Genome polyprotein n=1 Tax=Atlantic salmon calicivirus TaxID=1489836 RepID=A0A023PKB8_9CALI|nr:polyprotein [Atlantic salmon calicivirus]